ncbi:hypothetical protein [Cohnella panacarvi]|uniref:hypothetical protein n=1 Tax=Cohnella panacarvi TaxID=400776 RepID=UPI00055459CA|nr:hypothetical protein [Cohnella panacarvi]
MAFDELLKELQGLKDVQIDSEGVSLARLLDETFMKKHSTANNFAEFLTKGNFQVETREDVRNIPDELFDRHVARETDFADWNAMLEAATKEYECRR